MANNSFNFQHGNSPITEGQNGRMATLTVAVRSALVLLADVVGKQTQCQSTRQRSRYLISTRIHCGPEH